MAYDLFNVTDPKQQNSANFLTGPSQLTYDQAPAQQQNNAPTGGGGGGGGYSAPVDPYAAQRAEDNSFLNDQEGQLRALLGRADTSLGQGITNLNNSYNASRTNATEDQNRTLRDYGVKREDTIRDKQSSIGKVNTNARTLSNSVRSIIGRASGSGSSAFQLAAPNAVSREASGQRTNVLETFGRNFRNLDTAENDAKFKYDKLLKDLEAQRGQREYDLRAGIDSQKNALSEKLANVAGERARVNGGGYGAVRTAQQPYQNEINTRQSELDRLFTQFNPTISYAPVDVQKPELSPYTVDRAAIGANQAQGADQYSPYSQFLKKRQEQV